MQIEPGPVRKRRILLVPEVGVRTRRRPRGVIFGSFVCVCLAMAPFFARAAQSPEVDPGVDEFGYGRVLSSSTRGGIQSVELDYDVYRRSVEPRLADLRVFDESGRPLPYAIRRRPARVESDRVVHEHAPPLFRLASLELGTSDRSRLSAAPGHSGETGPATGATGPEPRLPTYRLEAEVTDAGAVVRIDPTLPIDVRASNVAAWLIDTRALEQAVVGIDLRFEETEEDLLLRVRVERSDDLASWRSVGSDHVVARLAQEGHRIERTTIELEPIRAKYLRLRPLGSDGTPALRSVQVRTVSHVAPERIPAERHIVEGRFDPAAPNRVSFDLGATLPIDSIRVLLGDSASLVEGRIEAAQEPDGPWTRGPDRIFYDYEQDGVRIRSRSIDWDARRVRYLRLVTSSRGGGLTGTAPRVEVAWRPERLFYLDRGTGRALLAVGRWGAQDAGFGLKALLRGKSRQDVRELTLAGATATLGPERVLAGPRAVDPERAIPIRTIGLWGLLIAIVGLVLGLGLRLVKSQPSETRPDES